MSYKDYELKIITEFELINLKEYNEERKADIFGISEDDIENGEISELFEQDPDYVKLDGEKYPYISFEDDDKKIQYIVIPNIMETELQSESEIIEGETLFDIMERMLKDFYLNDERIPKKFNFDQFGKWNYFEGFYFGIAFRGGKGYSYGLYEYLDVFPGLSKKELLSFVMDNYLEEFIEWRKK